MVWFGLAWFGLAWLAEGNKDRPWPDDVEEPPDKVTLVGIEVRGAAVQQVARQGGNVPHDIDKLGMVGEEGRELSAQLQREARGLCTDLQVLETSAILEAVQGHRPCKRPCCRELPVAGHPPRPRTTKRSPLRHWPTRELFSC